MKSPAQIPGVQGVLKALDACDLPAGVKVWIEVDGPAQAPAPEREVRLIKSTGTPEEQYTLGIVLEPLKELGKKDLQKDTYSAEEVRQACQKWMEDYQDIGRQHTEIVTDKVKVVHNWITHEDTTIGGQFVHKGTWIVGVHVCDAEMWAAVKRGEITGFSIGGSANREPLRS